MHARVVRQLRMERRDEEAAVAHEHRLAVALREHLDVRPDVPHARRADEDAAQRLVVARQREIGLEARDLTAVRVPVDDEVDEPEMLAVEHDHPRAGAEDRLLEAAHRLVEPVQAHQPHERRRLAAGDHEPVEPVRAARACAPRRRPRRAAAASPRARGSCPALRGRRSSYAPRLQHEVAAVLVDRLPGDRASRREQPATGRPRSPPAAPSARAARPASPRRYASSRGSAVASRPTKAVRLDPPRRTDRVDEHVPAAPTPPRTSGRARAAGLRGAVARVPGTPIRARIDEITTTCRGSSLSARRPRTRARSCTCRSGSSRSARPSGSTSPGSFGPPIPAIAASAWNGPCSAAAAPNASTTPRGSRSRTRARTPELPRRSRVQPREPTSTAPSSRSKSDERPAVPGARVGDASPGARSRVRRAAPVPRVRYQPRTSRRSASSSDAAEIPTIASPSPRRRPRAPSRPRSGSSPRRSPSRACLGVARLEDPRADEDAVRAELHAERRVGRRRDPARGERHDRQAPVLGDPAHELERRAQLLRLGVELLLAQRLEPADAAEDRAHVRDGVDDVAGARLALRADHRRALRDPPERLAEVRAAADERDGELPLVHVVLEVGRRQHLGLVDVVDLERLEDLRLDEVADPALRHHRDRHRLLDLADLVRVAHARDPALRADVGRDALERHHRDGARLLGDRAPGRRRRRP